MDSLNAMQASTNLVPDPPGVSNDLGSAQTLYQLLLHMDNKIQQHTIKVNKTMLKPVTPDDPLKRQEQWFRDMVQDIQAANPGGDKATTTLREAMLDHVLNQYNLIETERKRCGHLTNVNAPENTFNTGK